MKTLINSNDQVYISDATHSLIERGLTSADQLIQPNEIGFTLVLEPVFNLSHEKLLEGKRSSAKYILHFKEEVILDLGSKGGSYFQIIKDLLFINGLSAVYDFSGNLVKKIDCADIYSYSLVDKNNNQQFILNGNQIYSVDENFETIFKTDKIIHNKNVLTFSNGLPAMFTKEFIFIGYG